MNPYLQLSTFALVTNHQHRHQHHDQRNNPKLSQGANDPPKHTPPPPQLPATITINITTTRRRTKSTISTAPHKFRPTHEPSPGLDSHLIIPLMIGEAASRTGQRACSTHHGRAGRREGRQADREHTTTTAANTTFATIPPRRGGGGTRGGGVRGRERRLLQL